MNVLNKSCNWYTWTYQNEKWILFTIWSPRKPAKALHGWLDDRMGIWPVTSIASEFSKVSLLRKRSNFQKLVGWTKTEVLTAAGNYNRYSTITHSTQAHNIIILLSHSVTSRQLMPLLNWDSLKVTKQQIKSDACWQTRPCTAPF